MRRLLLLAPLPLALSACVYTSAVPLGDPADAPLEEALVGDWLVQDEDPDEDDSEVVLPIDSAGIRIQRFNQHEYLVEYEEWACAEFRLPRTVERRLRAFVSVVDKTRFLNIQDIEGDSAYMLARYTVNGAELRLRFVADGDGRGLSGKYATSDALSAAVRARLDDPRLFEQDSMLLVRLRPSQPRAR